MLTDEQIDEITELGLKTYDRAYHRVMAILSGNQETLMHEYAQHLPIADKRAEWFAMQAMAARIQSILSGNLPKPSITPTGIVQ